MPDLTPKIGLKKPLGNEAVSRAAYNEVLDQLDEKMPVGNGDVTDTMIGIRTLSTATAPITSTGILGVLLNGLAYMIKSITGKASWYAAPSVTLDELQQTKAANNHDQPANSITAGVLAGRVQANPTAAATLGNAQVRDIYAGTAELTPGTSALPTGTIYVMYE